MINIKNLLILMFITGILQWDILGIPWQYLTIISVIHALTSILVSVFLMIPFVNKHAYYHIVKKRVNSPNGWLLGLVFLFITFSGFYLFFIGNTGGDIIGSLSFYVHLYGSFLFMILFLIHIKKRPEMTFSSIVLSLLLLSILNPTSAYSEVSKLSLLKLEKNITAYHIEDWTNSTKCKSCHEEIFNQWADSNHKNLVDSNPYYMVMETIAAEVEGEEFRQWCMSCHNPSALTTGLTKTSHPMTNGNFLTNTLFEKGAKTLVDNYKTHGNSRLEEGVSCLTCHRIMEAKSDGNASYTLDLTNRKKYPFEDEDSGINAYLGEKFINSKPFVTTNSTV